MSNESSEERKTRLFFERINNRMPYDFSKEALTYSIQYKSRIDKCREKRFELENKITNDDLSTQIEHQKRKTNRIKREFYRYIDGYIENLEEHNIDYEKYIPPNKKFKFRYVYQIAYGVLNDI